VSAHNFEVSKSLGRIHLPRLIGLSLLLGIQASICAAYGLFVVPSDHMKACVPILCLAICVLYAEETQGNPYATATKKAAELIQCANKHKTLRDVPIVYGHVGGLRSNPETAAKVDRGEIILGGCIVGGRDHLVVCATCGLSYDDSYEAWQESFPSESSAPENKMNPPCTAATIQQKLSKELKDITLDVAGSKSSFPSYSRWINASGIVGEQVLVLTETRTQEVQTKLEEWVRKMGAPRNADTGVSDTTKGRWEWMAGGKSFDVSLSASENEGSYIRLEWHTVKKDDVDD